VSLAYFDTSAIIKLIRVEQGSKELRNWLTAPAQQEWAWVRPRSS
jgi:hypothetical protein